MLPYASYLRVYEPVGVLSDTVRTSLANNAAALAGSGVSVEVEQRTALVRAVASARLAVAPDQLAGAYFMRREARTFCCPVDMPLRSWLSLTSLVENIGDSTVNLIYPADTLAVAGDEFLRWRRDHPRAVPHIQQSTWGVPRTWFVLVVEDERETYDDGGTTSVRYRAQIRDARRRLASAHKTLRSVIDDTDLLGDLGQLGAWLEEFDDASWLELDYAGVAALLADQLATDQSARDVHHALDALRREDFATAGSAYRTFEERWRSVNAFERAN